MNSFFMGARLRFDRLGLSETMSILSDEERAAIQALPLGRSRIRRAEALVNPASGLANDYLNLFNEIVMLVEQLPTMPELFDDIQRWHPMSYRDYFRQSVLPGRISAIEAYDLLNARFRYDFEAVVAELDCRATGAVAAVRKHFKSQGGERSASPCQDLRTGRCDDPRDARQGDRCWSTTAPSSSSTSTKCRSAPTRCSRARRDPVLARLIHGAVHDGLASVA